MSSAVIQARTRYAQGSKSLKAAKKSVADIASNKDSLVLGFLADGLSEEDAEALYKHRYDEASALQKYWEDEVRAAFADIEEIDPRNHNTFSP